MKSWYSAKLLFRADVNGREVEQPLYEESIRLVRANDEADAKSAANALGAQEQHEYKNEFGETVRWKFVELVELQDLCEEVLREGVEVFSRLFRKSL